MTKLQPGRFFAIWPIWYEKTTISRPLDLHEITWNPHGNRHGKMVILISWHSNFQSLFSDSIKSSKKSYQILSPDGNPRTSPISHVSIRGDPGQPVAYGPGPAGADGNGAPLRNGAPLPRRGNGAGGHGMSGTQWHRWRWTSWTSNGKETSQSQGKYFFPFMEGDTWRWLTYEYIYIYIYVYTWI